MPQPDTIWQPIEIRPGHEELDIACIACIAWIVAASAVWTALGYTPTGQIRAVR